jgi:hypothetical protein
MPQFGRVPELARECGSKQRRPDATVPLLPPGIAAGRRAALMAPEVGRSYPCKINEQYLCTTKLEMVIYFLR